MTRWQGHGAQVTITDHTLVIERTGSQAQKFGARQSVTLRYLAGFHVRQPTMLTPGWIQLCVGVVDPAHRRDAAVCDPHTVLFTRAQREQMTGLAQYLGQLVDGGPGRADPPGPDPRPVERPVPEAWTARVTATADPATPAPPVSAPDEAAGPTPAPPGIGAAAAPPTAAAPRVDVSEPTGPNSVAFDSAPRDTTAPTDTTSTGPAASVDATGPHPLTRTTGPARAPILPKAMPPAPNPDADPDHPLYGQTVVITGILSGLDRTDAWAQLAECGARVHDNVTRGTTVLVSGGWADDGGQPENTRNLATARRLRDAGQRLAIIDEKQMAALIAGDHDPVLPDPATPAVIDPYALGDDSSIAPQHRADPRQQVRGRHYCVWGETVRQLVDDDRLDEALGLLLDVIAVAEQPDNCGGGAPVPGWTEQAADVYRRQSDHVGEVAVLQRWFDAARRNGYPVDESHPLVPRIAAARASMDAAFRRQSPTSEASAEAPTDRHRALEVVHTESTT